VPFPCQKGGMGVELRVLVQTSPLFVPRQFLGQSIPLKHKEGELRICPLRTRCVGLFAMQKSCISGNPGNTLFGHHLIVRRSSVRSQGMPCQVLKY
jgi:hypothetical protein